MLNPAENPAEEISPPEPAAGEHDPYAALRFGNLRLYLVGNTIAVLGTQMQTVAIGWEVWQRTHSAHSLAMIGLIQVIPILALALLAGQAADRFNRKRLLMVALCAMAASSSALAAISLNHGPISAIYGCLLLNSAARAFQQPAKSSLLPLLVPRRYFSNAVSWSMTGFQLASVLGPAVGGQLIAAFQRPAVVYYLEAAIAIAFAIMLNFVRHAPNEIRPEPTTARTLLAGIGFLWRNQIILAALTLDLFAVLLGGAVSLLPIYAEEILQVGPAGLGWLTAAPAVGALLMSVVVAHRPPFERSGRALLLAVAGFGAATIVFGLSRYFWLSLAMLFVTGALDNISVVVRHTLVQMLTPDAMRGRVSAVNGVFISASNELGGFESGKVAAWFSPTISVVSGGIGTLLVVAIAAVIWPSLRRYGRLGDPAPTHSQVEPSAEQLDQLAGTGAPQGIGATPPGSEAKTASARST